MLALRRVGTGNEGHLRWPAPPSRSRADRGRGRYVGARSKLGHLPRPGRMGQLRRPGPAPPRCTGSTYRWSITVRLVTIQSNERKHSIQDQLKPTERRPLLVWKHLYDDTLSVHKFGEPKLFSTIFISRKCNISTRHAYCRIESFA